ncbi:hypothetical protein VTN49DRAFT_591 [Thermomyces lanuginosus]|uniref:uncharacterized protein n=1 Tax=Thermomyces lanuginosus TaxID=5541 RepID=UPI0037439115
MGLADLFTDIVSSLGFTEAHAEAPSETTTADETPVETPAKDTPSEDSEPAAEDEGAEETEEAAEEEEEAEPEEPEDPKPKLEEECANSSKCAPYKHHFDECVERVTRQQEDPDYKGPKEDCVEEFFHLQHCASQCAAPKLWKVLK